MNKKLCTLLHLVYHSLFGSTMYVVGSDYLDEFRKLRNEITIQSQRVTTTVEMAELQLKKAESACKKITRIRL